VTEPHLDHSAWNLLRTHLDSFEKLEVVRALRGTGQAMSRDDLGRECRFTSDTIDEVVASLARMNVVETDGARGAVHLGSMSLEPAFQSLMTIYEHDRLVVMSALSSIAMERIRNMAAKAFADAFVLRKK
jgi:hypothetical protein